MDASRGTSQWRVCLNKSEKRMTDEYGHSLTDLVSVFAMVEI